MGKKKKLLRFADNKIFPNVFEPPLLEFFDKEKGGVVNTILQENGTQKSLKTTTLSF